MRAILEAEAAEAPEVTRRAPASRPSRDFIPPANTREREMQILCAVLESHEPRAAARDATATSTAATVAGADHEIKRELRLG